MCLHGREVPGVVTGRETEKRRGVARPGVERVKSSWLMRAEFQFAAVKQFWRQAVVTVVRQGKCA